MIKVVVENKEIHFPNEISIEKWQAMVKYDITNKDNWYKIISILLDIEYQSIENLEQETLDLLMGLTISLMNQRVEAPMENLEKMTFGQFVDLEVYLSLNYTNYIKDMMNILSPYTKTSDKALYVIEKWLNWRTHIYRQYKGLFQSEEGEETGPSTKTKMSVAKSWYKIIIELSNNNILKVEEIENQPFRKMLNYMAYLKEQKMIQDLEIQKNKRINEVRRRR